MARPTGYTKAKGLEICRRLAVGDSLEIICKADKMPTSETVRQWKRKHEEFSANYTRAREDQGEYYGQKVQDTANKCIAGEIKPDVARVAMDGFKWTAARMNRAVYGDKVQVDANITASVSVDNLEKGKLRNANRTKPQE